MKRYYSKEDTEMATSTFLITNHQGNANKNQLTSVDMAVKKEKRHVGKDVEKREHLCTVSGNVD